MAASNQFILLTFKSLHVLKKSVHGHRKAFKEHQPSAVCFSISVPWVPNHRQGMQVFQTQDSLARRRMLETLELWSCQVERSWSDACHLPETHTKKWYLENKICPVLVTAPAVINHPDQGNLGRKGFSFSLAFHSLSIITGSRDRNSNPAETLTRTCAEDMKTRCLLTSLVHHGLLSLLSFRTQDHQYRGVPIYNGLTLPHWSLIKNLLPARSSRGISSNTINPLWWL
jgi:hypothetical protein